MELSTSRPRVIGWLRSAAILDGDWGTSIAYVLGIAFALAGYNSGWHLMMMVAFTILIALNYITICRLYPNGGGVYSSVSHRSRTLAVIGALLLGADYVVTTSLSVLDSCHYLDVPEPALVAIVIIAFLGVINWFGPRHAGAFAIIISAATLFCLFILILVTIPVSSQHIYIHPAPGGFLENWRIFVGIVLSISGIEAISNMTGVMKNPHKNSRRAILIVLGKISIATVILTFAMLAIPNMDLHEHKEEMIRFLGTTYVGDWFGSIIGFVMGLLLISAGNTAINGLTAIQFLMAVDGELPSSLRKLNKHGVPAIPLIISTIIPIFLLVIVHDVLTLAQMYAIGVVGAILINIGSTCSDRGIKMKTPIRVFMVFSTIILFFIEATIAVEKVKALIFALIVLAVGLGARRLTRKQPFPATTSQPATTTSTTHIASPKFQATFLEFDSRMMVALKEKGEQLLRQACDEARIRKSFLFILNIKEISVMGILPEKIDTDSFPKLNWVHEICTEYGVPYKILTILSNEVGYTITETAATLGIERLILGATKRKMMEKTFRGDVIRNVSQYLPEEIHLVIYRA